MLIAGIDPSSSAIAVRMARQHQHLFASVGIHPHDAKRCSEASLSRLRSLAADANVVAWGEIGLDFNRMYSPQQNQERCFIRQLEIADELELPLIFHERDSDGRFLQLLDSMPSPRRRAVVHCFSGTETELSRYLEMDFYIGITGIVTIKQRGALLRRMIPAIPPDRLLVETDAPYLTPAPHRNRMRRNEPAFVREVLLRVAEVRGDDPACLAAQTWTNTCRLFAIDETAIGSSGNH